MSKTIMSPIAQRRTRLGQDLAKGRHKTSDDRRIFLIDRADEALAELDAWTALERIEAVLPPLAGAVLTVKACLDVAGWLTGSGSLATADAAPADSDAPVVGILRAAGAVLFGQTNMTEFAYGALGVNSHFGTPRTPLDPTGARVAGGSTSGGAVAAATGLADLSLGSDTSGSARIPAAFCGCFGFKPSRARYPREGMAFLSSSFDVPGLLSADLALITCADQVLACGQNKRTTRPNPRALRFAVPANIDDLGIEPAVRAAFDAALAALSDHGVRIEEIALPTLGESATITAVGGMIAAEAYTIHRRRLATHLALYDPLVGERIRNGEAVPLHRYITALRDLLACAARFDHQIAGFDGFLLPTTPILAPRLADLTGMEDYLTANARAFSFTEYANRLDLPSITVPLGGLPTGLMLTGTRGGDAAVLAQAQVLAECIAGVDLSSLAILKPYIT